MKKPAFKCTLIILLGLFPAIFFARQANAGTLYGRVFDSRTSSPISGAQVYSFNDLVSTSTDASGYFSLNNLTTVENTVQVSAAGYQTLVTTIYISGTVPYNFYLAPILDYVTGTVRNSQTDSPVSGASISYGGTVMATTSITGYFSLLIPSGSQEITVSASGYTTKQVPVIVPSPDVVISIDPAVGDHCDQAGPCATDIAINGDPLSGAFETPTDVDFFKFQATNGVQYEIETSNLGSGCDTVLSLYAGDGSTLLAFDDDGGAGLASKITWTATASSLVYVKVAHFDSQHAAGTYQIAVRGLDDHCDTAGTCATLIQTDWTPVDGRIEVPGDVDFFRFQAASGVNYTIETQVTSPSDTVIALYRPDGSTLILQDDDGGVGLGSRISWDADSDGTYYILVRQYSPYAAGAYRLLVKGTDDHCGTMTSCATYLLPNDTPTPGAFQFDNDEDWFQFQVVGDPEYPFPYTMQTSDLSPECDTFIYLYDSSGTQLALDDDGGVGYASQISYDFTANGIYYLRVRHYSSSGRGSYKVSVSVPWAELLVPGAAPVSGSFDADYDADIFLFYAERDRTYTIETTNLSVSPQCDTYIYLWAPDGVTNLAEDDDGGEGLASKITFTATTTGIHYVVVYHYQNLIGSGGGRGTYEIGLTEVDDHANDYTGATDLPTNGTPVYGQFESPGDQDWFRFSAIAGTRYIIETGELLNGCDTVMELYGPDGATLIAQDDDGGNEPLASRIDWTPTQTATCYIRLRHYDTQGTGDYKIWIQSLAADDHPNSSNGATPLEIDGTHVSGRIDVPADSDWFSFNAVAGNRYLIETSNLDSQCDTVIQLIAPDGSTILLSDDDGGEYLASRIIWTANTTGTYYVRVSHYSYQGTGAYEISVQSTTEPACQAIGANGSKTGSLNQPGEGKLYCISLSRGDRIDVTLDGPASGADFDLYLKMGSPPSLASYDVRGFTTSADESCVFTMPESGTLYIWVKSYSGTGAFTVRNIVTPYSSVPCEQITEGEPVAGSLGNAGDDDLYCIDVGEGDQLLVQLDGPASGADFDLYLKLGAPPTLTDYDARGYSPLADEIAALSQLDSGIVYVRVLSFSGQGNYSLTAQITGAEGDCSVLSGNPASGTGRLDFPADSKLFCYQTDGSALDITLSGPGDADFDLYAKFGSPPTLSDYDAASWGLTSQEMIHFAPGTLGTGTLYIMVLSYYGQGDFGIQVAVNEVVSQSIAELSSGDPDQIMVVKGLIADKTSGQGLQPNNFCITIKDLGKYCYSSDPNVTSQIVYLPGGYFFFVAPKMVSPITCTLSDISCYQSLERDFDENTISNILFEVELDDAADCDNDGMPAGWEKSHGLDIWKNDAQLDFDQDGYSNIQEYQSNTDPNSKDSVPTESKAPVVTGLTNDPGPVASKTWHWDADEPATFRCVIDTNPNGVPAGVYSNVKTATQSSGKGIYYIHVQAKDAEGNESAIFTVWALIDSESCKRAMPWLPLLLGD